MEGKDCYLILQENEENITKKQYAYFFKGIIKAECMNSEMFSTYTMEEIREIFENLFLSEQDVVDGKLVNKKVTIDKLTKVEFAKFIEKVIAWLKENDINVKTIDEYWYEQTGNKKEI